MKEIWKKWKDGYDSKLSNDGYKSYPAIWVSNYGNIRGRNITKDNRGYSQFFYKNRPYRVHRVVAELFIPNPDNKPCIDHIDTNKLNNRIDNLKWCTYQENNNNPITRKHNKDNHADFTKGNNPSSKPVYDDVNHIKYDCAKDYADSIGRNPKTVRNWLEGKRKFPQGYSAHYI